MVLNCLIATVAKEGLLKRGDEISFTFEFTGTCWNTYTVCNTSGSRSDEGRENGKRWDKGVCQVRTKAQAEHNVIKFSQTHSSSDGKIARWVVPL
jgi:hypothetical protein